MAYEKDEREVGNLPDCALIEWVHIGGDRFVMCIFKKNGNYYASTYTKDEIAAIHDDLGDLLGSIHD